MSPRYIEDAIPPHIRARLAELVRQWREAARTAAPDAPAADAHVHCADELADLLLGRDV